MPKTQTNTPHRVKDRGPRRTSVARRRAHDRGMDHAYVYQGGHPTHVLVPIDEYERMVIADLARSAAAKLEEPHTHWVAADTFALRLAGERIATARKAAGLTQEQLGEKLGLPQSQISRIERRPDRTTVRTLRRLAEALGVNVGALL